MKKKRKIIAIVGTISAGILGMLGYSTLFMRNQIPEALYGVFTTEDNIHYFNAAFTSYVGTQRGSTVRSLIRRVDANNSTYEDFPITVTVLTEEFDAKSLGQALSKIKSSIRYNVELKYDNTGRVCEVIVTEAGV